MVVLLQRHLQLLITISVAIGIIIGGVNHFATASDVQQKFVLIQNKVDSTAQQQRKERIENELFRLRQERKTQANDALIKRYESQLDDADKRLRDLDRESRAVK